MTKRSEQRLHKEKIGMANKHMKRSSVSLATRKIEMYSPDEILYTY